MNNTYIAYKDKAFIVGDQGITEKPYSKRIASLAKLENMMELLEECIKSRKKNLKDTKTELTLTYIPLSIFWSISLLILAIILKTDIPNLQNGLTQIFTDTIPAIGTIFIATTMVYSMLNIIPIIKKRKKIKGLDAETEYLSNLLENRKQKLKELNQKALEEKGYSETPKKEDFREYTQELEERIENLAAKINYLGRIKKRILKEYNKGNLEKFLQNKGFTPEEIAEGKKFVMIEAEKSHAA
ncbi:MAG: hypothetical protein HFG33_04065 [Bacilli bacterium]|nr:hypothetical protein [Bacilli bacterium]